MSDEDFFDAVDEADIAWHEEERLKAGESAVADAILTGRDEHLAALTTNWLTVLHDSGNPVWHVPGYAGTSREATFVNRLVDIRSRQDARNVPNPRDLMPVWGPRVLREAGKRAALKRHPISLTESDMLWLVWRSKGRCEVSGLPFDMAKLGDGQWRPFTPSIDRVSSRKGYAMSNVRLVTLIANVAMNGWGEAPLRRLAEALVNGVENTAVTPAANPGNTPGNTSSRKSVKSLKRLVPRGGIEPPTLRFSVEPTLLILLIPVTAGSDFPGGQRGAQNAEKPRAADAGGAGTVH
jgi:hypothetical protein